MIFRNLPAIITLIAALVALVVTFIYKYNLTKALIIVLAAAVGFFILGSIVKAVLNHFLNPEEEKNAEPADGEEAAADNDETEDNE